MKVPDSLRTNITFLTGDFEKLLHTKLTSAFKAKQFDVTVEQFAILAILWYQDGINQGEIAQQLNRDKTTITRVLDNMLKKDFIIRKVDPKDKRGRLIFLTDKGRSVQSQMLEVAGDIYTQALKGIDAAKIQLATEVLTQMIKNLA